MNKHYPMHDIEVATLPRISVDELRVEEITLETKQSVLDRVIEANNRLPTFQHDRVERFFNGIPTYKA